MNRRPSLTIGVLLMVMLLGACATTEEQALEAATDAGELAAGNTLPDYPEDCRRISRSGVRAEDRLDVALISTDQALGKQNARTQRCAAWYDKIRSEIQKSVP